MPMWDRPAAADLLDAAGEVIAVDHFGALARDRRRRLEGPDASRVSFHAADLRSLPIDDAAVDAVLSVEVVQHIPTDALRLDALRELYRVLPPVAGSR